MAIKRAGEVVRRAKEPKELDGLTADFGHLQESQVPSNGRDQRLQQRIQGSVSFLTRWQEYLAAQVRGDDQAVNNALRNLGENGYNHPLLIPRSEVLARLPDSSASSGVRRPGKHSHEDTTAATNEILDGTRNLNNGATTFDGTTDLGGAVYNLQAIQKARAERQGGIATTINMNTPCARPKRTDARTSRVSSSACAPNPSS